MIQDSKILDWIFEGSTPGCQLSFISESVSEKIGSPEIRLVGQQDTACLIRNDNMTRLRTEGYDGRSIKHQDRALNDAIKWLDKLCVIQSYSTFFLKHQHDVTTQTITSNPHLVCWWDVLNELLSALVRPFPSEEAERSWS